MKFFFLSLFFIVLISGCAKKEATFEIQYLVTGSGGNFSVAYSDANNITQNDTSILSGWTYSFVGHSGQTVSLSATNKTSGGTVTVIIYSNSAVFDSITSSGPFVTAAVAKTL